MLRKLLRSKKGAALVEYGLLIAGVALVSAAAVAVFGHKTNELIGSIATVLPGAHEDDNAPISAGQLLETTDPAVDPEGKIRLDIQDIEANSNEKRLRDNLDIPVDLLILEPAG